MLLKELVSLGAGLLENFNVIALNVFEMNTSKKTGWNSS
jgi:hypothetical protein